MTIEVLGRFVLALEALACLWLGRWGWRESENEGVLLRAVGPLLFCAAAAVILYGIVQT
jgi:hypothetical protein